MPRHALHLCSFLLSLTALLYGGVVGGASEAPDTNAAEVSADPAVSPHLALLLPTESDTFARAAEAVRAGFMEAAKKQPASRLAVRLYPVTDDPQHVVAAYRQALAAGATMVVGPLTRSGVTALAGASTLIAVPTLALNVPDGAAVNPENFYTLSLQVEGEARQIAQFALSAGRRKALTVTEPSALGRRMRDAFVEEFQQGGGYHIADYAYATDIAALERLKHASLLGVADMVFLAADAVRARTVRPSVAALEAYGTSQLSPGLGTPASFLDLSDVRFVDMPWMVQPDHPAVVVYARPGPRGSDDMERLRALGVDAFRVAQDLIAGKRDIDIDGVTGHLTLGSDRQVRRGLRVTVISDGRLTLLGEKR